MCVLVCAANAAYAYYMYNILLIRNDDQFDYINKCQLRVCVCVCVPGIKIRVSIYVCVWHMAASLCVCVCVRVFISYGAL